MNVTFLIGNGFDRNLGLDTTYSDFIKVYKESDANTQALKNFRSFITENEELWSSAELAFGKYTGEFGGGEGERFSECQDDFCQNLALYLKEQELRIDYSTNKDAIFKAFSHLNNITSSFPTQERAVLDGVYKNCVSEGISFNFICYNYSQLAEEKKKLIENRIHITGENIFQSIHNIANPSVRRVSEGTEQITVEV